MVELIVCCALLLLLLVLGVLEKQRNERDLKQLKLRINVNGIRGKSTATRLITGVLWEAGCRTIGKTTGTAARMFFWDTDEEEEVKRPPRGINISEQLRVIHRAVQYGADSLVCECMAVRPEYQRVYQHQMIQSDLTVIVNVLEDHLEEMGPTLDQIADALADTIPYHGIAVVPDCPYTKLFQRVASERDTQVFVIRDDCVSERFLDLFDYRLFQHNVAVGLTVARALGIPPKTALKGMLHAPPDPGALRYYHLNGEEGPFLLVNAFAANEPFSTLDIWNAVREEYPALADNPVLVMNCRPDRVDRTDQFIREFFRRIPNAILIAVGEGTRRLTSAYQRGMFRNITEYHDCEGQSPERVLEQTRHLFSNRVVLCVGNIHGIGGEPVLEAILDYGGHPSGP